MIDPRGLSGITTVDSWCGQNPAVCTSTFGSREAARAIARAKAAASANNDDECGECNEDMPFGPYYRYETSKEPYLSNLATSTIHGNPPNNGGLFPAVQAYPHDKYPNKPYRIKFCTNASPDNPSDKILNWYSWNHGVTEVIPDELVRIPIVVLP